MTWAGTPARAEGSSRSRHARTAGSASGTLTISPDCPAWNPCGSSSSIASVYQRAPTGGDPIISTERPTDVLPETAAADSDTTLRLTLLEALARLPAKDRAVVVLRYWEDRSIQETAEAMNTSSAAVRTRCSRALARLRMSLGEDLAEYAAT